MTLEKALEIILLDLHENEKIMSPDAANALRIAAEAIEYMLEARRTHAVPVNNKLLHETK